MNELTGAIAAMQDQIAQLQNDIETLQRATTLLRGTGTPAKAISGQPKAKRKRRKVSSAAAKGAPGQSKTTQMRKPTWSAAEREAISKRMKVYWAKRRKARR